MANTVSDGGSSSTRTGGHWERRAYRFSLPNGGSEIRYQMVWVQDKAPVKRRPKPPKRKKKVAVTVNTRQQQIARQNEAAARLGAAAAVAKAQQQAVARARAIAYQELRAKQLRIINSRRPLPGKPVTPAPMIRPPQGPAGPGQNTLTEQQQMAAEKAYMRQKQQEALQAATRAKAKRDALIKGGSYEFPLPNGGTETRFYPQKGDPQTGKDLEEQIRLEAAEARRTGKVDNDYLKKLQGKYEEHAKAVYAKYERLVAQLNAALAKKNMKRARDLYYSSEFKAARDEFTRLYGKGTDPTKDGEYGKFYEEQKTIANSQREWWKSQMRAALQSQLNQLEHQMGPFTDTQTDERKMIQAQLDAFNGKTTRVPDQNMPGGYRYLTLEEELQRQQALIIAQREKLAAERNRNEMLRKKDMMLTGYVDYKNTMVKKDDLPLIQTWERLVAQNPALMPEGGFRRPDQVQSAANTLLSEWERANPKPSARFPGDYQRWKAKRDAYEKYVYEFFGNKPPEWWERAISAPGISHALSLLQAPNSAIGAGGRVLTALFSGSSTIGVNNLDMNNAPSSYKASQAKAERDFLAKNGYGYRWQQGLAMAKEQARQAWLASPEGRQWVLQQQIAQRQKSQQEDIEFKAGFYGGNTNALPQIAKDPGGALRALNEYGQAPFQNEGANLLFNLLADPTNAIPLKATTYLARGKYAFEAAEAAKGLLKPTAKASAAMRAFLTVDEGTLKKIMQGEKLMKELKVEGMSIERLTDLFREQTAGLSKLAERKSVLNDILRRTGFLPREVSESQLFNLVEDLAVGLAEKRGLHLLTEVEKQAKITEDLLKQADVEAKAAEASLKADREVVQRSQTIRAKANQSAREVLQKQRASSIAAKTPPTPKPVATPRASFARFRLDSRGNSAAPAVFKEEAGYVYRVVHEARVGSDWRAGEFASRKLQTVYVTDLDRSIILRVKESKGFEQATSGLNAKDNVRAKAIISADEVEVLTAEGNWVPVSAGSQTPEARLRAEAAGRNPMPDPFTGEPRPYSEQVAKAVDAEEAKKYKAEMAKAHGHVDQTIEKTAALEKKTGTDPDPAGPIPFHADDPYADNPLPSLSEQDWLRKEKFRAHTVLTSKTSSAAAKNAARARIKLIERAEEAIKGERRSAHHVKLVLKAHGAEAKKAIPPNQISPLALSSYDAGVEQVRSLWRRLLNTPVGPVEGGTHHITVGGKQLDHIPKHVYDEVEAKVSAYIRAARGGWRNELLTKRKQKGGSKPELQLGEEPPIPIAGRMSDKDPLVLEAKKQALLDYARDTGTKISVEAYDEARHVLWRSFVQNKSARYLLTKAKKYRLLNKDVSLEDAFLHVRKIEAEKESLRQLQVVAREMPGFKSEEIMAEFLRRYSDDGILYHPAKPLSEFQRATVEGYIKDITGFNELDDRMAGFLQSANRPPFENRELTKGFLTRIGAWSPRKSELFLADATSWSVQEEARYWLVNYGEIPEWADELALVRGNKAFFRNDGLHYAQLQAWGVFNRAADLKMRASGKTAKEIEAAQLESGRRSLAQQRKFAIERYGKLVSRDGKTLDEMPWLMNDGEYRRYLARDMAEALPPQFIQNAAELDEFIELANKVLNPLFEKYIGEKAVDGVVDYTDLLRYVSEVQATLLASPKWARRHRDILGDGLNTWAWFNRWLVFSNPSFLVTNVIDAPIKTAYYTFTRRGLFSVDLARVSADARAGALSLTPSSIGYDTTSAMYRVKQASVKSRLTDPRGYSDMERAVDRGLALVDGTGAVFPEIAGRVELAHQMALARQIYATFYDDAIKRLGDTPATRELADAYAKNMASKEARHMWPSAGDAPIERLWNRIVPFASYSVRNKLMFISEAVGHPALLNYIDAIGRYIEQENLKNWEANPDTKDFEMPEHLRRRLEIPWAKGYYLDLSTFTDASRGLKPLFADNSNTTAQDFAAQWIRLVNPGPQAGIYALFNAFGLFPRTGWVLNANGEWERRTVGWTEPWSKDNPDLSSVFWMVDAMESAQQYGIGGFTGDEATMLLGQVLFFNGISTYDKGSVYNAYYFTLKEKSPEDAKKWLLTPHGKYLLDWWEDRAKDPKLVKDQFSSMAKNALDPSPWFHDQTPQFQKKLKDARDLIRAIRQGFAAELSQLTPGTKEYREMKARMYMAINNVYLNTPELMYADVFSKTPTEWAAQLEDWEIDKHMDDFMALSRQRPARGDYASAKAYNAAVEEWEHQKTLFLQAHPQVAARLASGRNQLDYVRDQMQAEWDTILKRIAKRNEAIEAAKSVIAEAGRNSKAGRKAQDYLDRAYLMNELDYSLLERDYAAVYFTQDDLDYMAGGGSTLLRRATVLLDFDATRMEKAIREGRLDEFLRKEEYGRAIRAAILYAKGGDPFGAFDGKRWAAYMAAHPDLQKQYFGKNPQTEKDFVNGSRYFFGITALWKKAGNDPAKWVRLLKQDPWLMREYFRRNPGKREQWARTDAYIKHISVWGKLIGAERFDEANDVWDNLPQWVKDEYYKKHPERRKASAQTAQYLGYMDKWVKLFDKSETEAMAYFNSLPKWAKERYFEKHPDKRAKFGLDAKHSTELIEYFAGNKEDRAAYLKAHPGLAEWLAKNSPAKASERYAILAAYSAIPKGEAWLRRVYREKYPEIFGQEAKGEARLKSVYDSLSRHPSVLPEFEQWVKVIQETYVEMLKHAPRPANSYIQMVRDVPDRFRKPSLSAEEAAKYSRVHSYSTRNPS